METTTVTNKIDYNNFEATHYSNDNFLIRIIDDVISITCENKSLFYKHNGTIDNKIQNNTKTNTISFTNFKKKLIKFIIGKGNKYNMFDFEFSENLRELTISMKNKSTIDKTAPIDIYTLRCDAFDNCNNYYSSVAYAITSHWHRITYVNIQLEKQKEINYIQSEKIKSLEDRIAALESNCNKA